MNEIEAKLKQEIKRALLSTFGLEVEENNIVIELPKIKGQGDYSSTVALRYAKELKSNPRLVAEKLKDYLDSSSLPLEKIAVAGPGFINFYFKNVALANIINTVIEKNDDYGQNQSGLGQKVLVEYVSVNPTGDMHVGHSKAAAWGDSVTRLMKASSYDVLREYYINDAGSQIDNLANSLISRYLELFNIDYPLPEDGYHGADIIEIAKNIKKDEGDKWVNADPNERFLYFKEEGTRRELQKIKNVLTDFGVEFDSWVSEKKVRSEGRVEKVIETLKTKGLTYENDGALWFKSTDFGDDKDRVLIKKDGLYTYLTPDIAYHAYKIERGYPKLIDLLGADHHGYINRMKAALQALGNPKDCLEIDLVQMVRLMKDGQEVKMSKRTGNAIALSELIEEIGVDSLRYFFCSRDVSTHLDFDLDLAVKQTSENPVYYAQYAYARICSILKAAPKFEKQKEYGLLNEPKEIALLKLISEFTNEVSGAAKTRSPNKICNYIQRLAQAFHGFYESCKVVNPANMDLTNQRVGLLLATKITLKNAFYLIGVSAPEKM